MSAHERVRTAFVSILDPALPPVYFDDWFRDVGAGQTVRVKYAATLPAGRAIAIVKVRPPQTAEMPDNAFGWRDPAVAIVGGPTWRRQ
jgi:hypothetical protein